MNPNFPRNVNSNYGSKRPHYQSARKGNPGAEEQPKSVGPNREKARSTKSNAATTREPTTLNDLVPETAGVVSEQAKNTVSCLTHFPKSDAAVLAALYVAWGGGDLLVTDVQLKDVPARVEGAVKEAVDRLFNQFGYRERTHDGKVIDHYCGTYVPYFNALRSNLEKELSLGARNAYAAQWQSVKRKPYSEQRKAMLSELPKMFVAAEKSSSASAAASVKEDANEFIVANLRDQKVSTLLDVIELVLNESSRSEQLRDFASQFADRKMTIVAQPGGNWPAFKKALLQVARESLPEKLRASCPKLDDPSVDEATRQQQLEAWVAKARARYQAAAEIAKSMVHLEMQATLAVHRGSSALPRYELQKGEWLIVPQLETEAPAVLCLNAALKERLNDKQSLPLMEATNDGKRTSMVSWRVFREGDCVPNMQLDPFYGSLDRSIVDAEFSRLQRFNIDRSFREESKIPRGSDLRTLLNEKKTLVLTVHHPLPFVASTADQTPAVFLASEKPGAAEISLEQLIAEALDKKLSQ